MTREENFTELGKKLSITPSLIPDMLIDGEIVIKHLNQIYDAHEAVIQALQGEPFTIVEAMESSYEKAKESYEAQLKAKDEEIERLKELIRRYESDE